MTWLGRHGWNYAWLTLLVTERTLPSDDFLYAYRFAIHAHPCENHPARLPASIPLDAMGACSVGLIRQDIYLPFEQIVDVEGVLAKMGRFVKVR